MFTTSKVLFSQRQMMRSPQIGCARAISDDGFTDLELDYSQNLNHVTLGNHSLPSPEEVRAGLPSNSNKDRRMLWIGMSTLLLLLVVIPSSIAIAKNNKTAASAPEVSDSSRFHETMAYLMDYVNHNTLEVPGSPQFRAAEWMADDDPLQLPLEQDNGHFLQRYALVVFYYSTQGDSTWQHQLKFLTNHHECDWNRDFTQPDGKDVTMGVLCNNDNIVEQLVIDNIGLTGTLPDELVLLNAMTRLVLPTNNLYGTIPQTVSELSELRDIVLSDNQFSQTLPSWVGDLTLLEQLVLSNNSFYGDLPDALEEAEELKLLALENNGFTGNLNVLGLLQEIQELYLQDNQFTGTIDYHWLTTLVNVKIVDVSNNLLQGGIPSQLLLLPQLQVLDLHTNNLTGTIEWVKEGSEKLRFLSLYNNKLSGSIPGSLHKFTNLEHLDLSNNAFHGEIPTKLGELSNLAYLFLSDNKYLNQASIPEWIQGLTNLRELSMRNVHLSGTLPEWLDDLKELQMLDLSENELEGTIPSLLGYASSLKFLLLNRNALTGTMPSELKELNQLVLLMLDKNSIHGNANEVCNLNLLQVFTSDCEIPEVVCTCCSKCCDDEDDACNSDNALANYEASFETGYSRDGYVLNPEQFVPAN